MALKVLEFMPSRGTARTKIKFWSCFSKSSVYVTTEMHFDVLLIMFVWLFQHRAALSILTEHNV